MSENIRNDDALLLPSEGGVWHIFSSKRWREIQVRIYALEEEVRFLRCLEAAGVDGWDGYEDAQSMFAEEGGEG